MGFLSPVDIANRALQHLGGTRISQTLGFTEDSKNAAAIFFAYDKLRKAELRSNLWKFATTKAPLRPVSGPTAIPSSTLVLPTMILAPTIWSSTTTYGPGAVVSDASNVLWISNFPDNLNYAPGGSYFWDLYTGPLAVQPWDTTGGTAYYAGDVVYTYPGDGTYQVFFSLQNSNTDN